MTTSRFGTVAATLVVALASGAGCRPGTGAQGGGAAVPFKLGTFARGGTPFVGLVLEDTQIVDIAPANAAFEAANASVPKLAAPVDMKQLIARYDANWKGRLAAIAAQQQRAGAVPEAASKAVSAPGIWERPAGDTRDNPYLFQKSPAVITGAFDDIVMPRGRTNIDFECEFNVVIGKPAKYVKFHTPPRVTLDVHALYLEAARASRWVWLPLLGAALSHARATEWWPQLFTAL